MADAPLEPQPLDLLAVTQGQWGERIADNVGRLCPPSWTVRRWAAPRALPLVVDDPEDYLPASFPHADLILALGETAGVAQLIPDIARSCGAKSVIAPIDRNESLPAGLAQQLRRWLSDIGVAAVFPRPFCSLTETTYNRPPVLVQYDDPLVQQFAAHFGQPQFQIAAADGQIEAVNVLRDSACGCAQFVAEGLVGCPVGEAGELAGMLHHHYPCLASMNQDSDYRDTLMHISGFVLRDAVAEQIQDHLEPTPYFRPLSRVDDGA